MEPIRRTKKSSYDIASACAMLAAIIIILVMATGCANVTVVKLAEMCHAHEGKPTITFFGESGKAECK